MELGTDAKTLLGKMLKDNLEAPGGIDAKRFRADHEESMGLLDDLQSAGFLLRRDDKYRVSLIALSDLENLPEVLGLLAQCNHIYQVLRQHYRECLGEGIALYELAIKTSLPRESINVILSFMIEAPIFGGYTPNFREVKEATVSVTEMILSYKTFTELLADMRSWRLEKHEPIDIETYQDSALMDDTVMPYIDKTRVEELKSIRNSKFDLTKLVLILEEINLCYQRGCFLATILLVRTLIDHVPPIFGCSSFSEVANHYGGQSLKKSMLNLEKSSRNIADQHLHSQIRSKEVLPKRPQVYFGPDIDVLLAEIVRVLR